MSSKSLSSKKADARARLICFFAAAASALAITAADGLSVLLEDGTRLIPGVARTEHILNAGVSFSFLGTRPVLAGMLSALALVCICAVALLAPLKRVQRVLLSAAWAGGACNLYSRVHLGFVRDWIRLDFIPFPVFNCADIFISLGLVLFALTVLFRKEGPHDPV